MDIETLRQRVRTIAIVLLENRSFDHVFGHMRLPDFGGRTDVDGIGDLADPAFANASADGTPRQPFVLRDGGLLVDLPHERGPVATQLAMDQTGSCLMNGFVQAYETMHGPSDTPQPPPLGILHPDDVPTSRFFADQYTLCDAWFAPLPTSTQPNRLMALSGYTLRDATESGLLAEQDTFLDWLDARGVRWRVYSAGLSFFALMPKFWPLLLTDKFRRLGSLAHDVVNESDEDWPEVILIEPDYDDSPVHLSGHACDNHPPLAIAFGEAFLRQVYEALTANRARWDHTVMIHTYDEHGGFFDHARPLPIGAGVPSGASYREGFATTGVRVPAVVVSPMVAAGSVCHATFDHTSILQLLAERFGEGEPYSAEVEARRQGGIASVSVVLDANVRRETIPTAPASPIRATVQLETWREPVTAMQRAFVAAAEGFAEAHGVKVTERFPEIAHWLAP